jgi:murein DD-endopeptidase MepM/ murein hydrolase activator NlpD
MNGYVSTSKPLYRFKLRISRWGIWLIALVSLLSSAGLGYGVAQYQAGKDRAVMLSQWQDQLIQQKLHFNDIAQQANFTFGALTKKLAYLDADMIRLNILGEKLVTMANFDPQEFNFNGSLNPFIQKTSVPPKLDGMRLAQLVEGLAEQMQTRRLQLNALDKMLTHTMQQQALTIQGSSRTIAKGWVSSYFGSRLDPLTGLRVWHSGVDIAGREGTEIYAMASGVVSFSGDRGGYGNLLEIHHGPQLTSRYAHNKELMVQLGEVVHKGQLIARMGHTGRTTGTHLHLEIRQDNRAVDPGRYFPDLKRKVT